MAASASVQPTGCCLNGEGCSGVVVGVVAFVDVAMKGVRLRTEEAGTWRVRSHHGTWGLMRWMIGCSNIAFPPTPMGQVLLLGSHALAGVIPRAKPAAIVEPLPLPIRSRRDDHRRGSPILGPIRNYRNCRVTVVLQPPRVTEGAGSGRYR